MDVEKFKLETFLLKTKKVQSLPFYVNPLPLQYTRVIETYQQTPTSENANIGMWCCVIHL